MTKRRYNAASPEDIEEKKLKDKIEKTNRLETWARVLGTKDGMIIIREILTGCYMYTSSFTGNSETFKNEGMRLVGLQIMETLTDVFQAGGMTKEQLTAFLITQLEQKPEDKDITIGKKPNRDFLNMFDDEYEVQ